MNSLLADPNKIYFSGINATEAEIEAALQEERSTLKRAQVIEKLELVHQVVALGKPTRKPRSRAIRDEAREAIRARA